MPFLAEMTDESPQQDGEPPADESSNSRKTIPGLRQGLRRNGSGAWRSGGGPRPTGKLSRGPPVVRVHCSFKQVLREGGLERPAGEPQPRIHDARHTFAVRVLEASPDGRDRIARHMLALSTYLGHGSIADTYWYLQATPRLLQDISDACARFLEEVALS